MPKGDLSALQRAFHRHGAAQCGICTPGMLMAAADLLRRNHQADARREVEDAIGGVLCRCTGYRKIVDAVLDVGDGRGARRRRPRGRRSARASPTRRRHRQADRRASASAPIALRRMRLWLRVVRSPHASARFTLGDARGSAPAPFRPGSGADAPPMCRATASASIPTSRTSRSWPPAARCAIAARRCWPWSGTRATVEASPMTSCRSTGQLETPVLRASTRR